MEPRRRFRFLKALSEGAFGKVYLAEMITGDNFRSVVAIKLLHGKWLGHEEIVQRSRDEARVLGLLHHRNIIRVEDLTAINGQCAIVMEFLDGVDLKSLVNYTKARGEIIPRKVAFEVIAAVASALEAAYNQAPLQGGEPLHLIHRDIKPSNVMITKAGDVKVLDFGTAQAKFDEREAHTQALAFGSAAYMAPERLLGDPDAPSGDVFSLGITLYELLAQKGFGKVHIRPEKYEEALGERTDALNLGDLGPERSSQVRQVLRLMLAYDAQDRPTARQVVDLMEALADEVHDGSMRRFARNVVAPCHEEMEPPAPEGDSLTGSTLFEDITGSGPVEGIPESDPGPAAYDETWIEDGRSPFKAPPELAADGTPVELVDDDPSGAADAAVQIGLGMSMPAPSILPADPSEPAPQAPGPARPSFAAPRAPAALETLPPETGFEETEAPTVVAAPPTAEPPPLLQAPPTPPPEAPRPTVEPPRAPSSANVIAPPPPVARSATPRERDQARAEPAPRPPTASTPPAPAKAGGGGKGLVIAVAALLVVAIVGGGGLFAARSMGLLGGDASTAVTTAEATTPTEGSPGGRVEVGPMDGTNGALSLALQPPGSASVSISSATGFKQDWDGTGRLDLVGLAPGTYRTKLTPREGSTVRAVLEVQAGQTCRYQFPTAGGSEWQTDGCE